MTAPGNNPEDFAREYDELRTRQIDHPGKVAHDRWGEIKRSLAIFQRNTLELTNLLHAFETNIDLVFEVMRFGKSNGEIRNEFYGQLDQRLQNFVASITSLVDVTRRQLGKNYPETDFLAEFIQRNAIVAGLPASTFLRRLRNYLLHYAAAPFVSSLRVSDDGMSESSQMLLDSQELLKFEDWNAGSKKYIESSGTNVDLRAPVEEVSEAMDRLYRWVHEQFQSIHGQDLNDLNELRERSAALLAEARLRFPGQYSPPNIAPSLKNES